MVGVSAILDTKSDNSSGSQALGVILIASSLILQAGLFVSEEIIFQHRHFEPMECVGGEGQFYIILIFNKFRDSLREFSILEF